MRQIVIGMIAMGLGGQCLYGKVDLVTLPVREAVQLTIYNSADLTLVRESRALTLREGVNRLQFSWANTLIDPTSLEMTVKAQADKIDIFDLTYPPRVRNLGLWNIASEVSGKVPVEITYLTSGLSELLIDVMHRLSGQRKGEPVIQLQTPFGGGKTQGQRA